MAATTEPIGADVLVQDFAFQPSEITVQVGGTVTWTIGSDPDQHTVTPRDPSAFQGSGQLFRGERFTASFSEPGTFEYFCRIHPAMVGTVDVVAAIRPSPTSGTTASGSDRPTVRPSPSETPESPAASPRSGGSVGDSGATGLPLVILAGLAGLTVLVLGGIAVMRRR